MNLNPGEVWLADLGLAAKTRPIVMGKSDREYCILNASKRSHIEFIDSPGATLRERY